MSKKMKSLPICMNFIPEMPTGISFKQQSSTENTVTGIFIGHKANLVEFLDWLQDQEACFLFGLGF